VRARPDPARPAAGAEAPLGLAGLPLGDPKRLFRLMDEVLTARADASDVRGLLRWCVDEVFETLRFDLGVVAVALYAEREGAFHQEHVTGAAPGDLALALDPGHPALAALFAHGTVVRRDPAVHAADPLGGRPFAAALVAAPGGRHLILLALPAQCDGATIDFVLATLRTVLSARMLQERWRRSLREAAEIQRGLLPDRAPAVPGYDVAGRSVTADEVGGDFYDFFDHGSGAFGLVVGDASGHGLPAALVARDVIVGLRMGMDGETKISRVLSRLNGVLRAGVPFSSFVSAFYAEVEPDGLLFYANAGHPPPLVVDAVGTSALATGDVALGPLSDARFRRRVARLEEGALLAVYTDGIVERRNRLGDHFGEERLVEALAGAVGTSAAAAVETVFAAAAAFGSGAPWEDDATLVVVRRLPPARPPFTATPRP
jgi:sigma-B regulation protein RsbU (phosphoserine phosphatase)